MIKMANGTIVKPASFKQLKWLRDLLEQHDYSAFPADWRDYCDYLREAFKRCEAEGNEPGSLNVWLAAEDKDAVTADSFRTLLEQLQKAPKAAKKVAAQADSDAATEDGYYLHGDQYFRVVHNRAGTNQYAHRMQFLMTPEKAAALAGQGVKAKVFKWVYAPGAFTKLKASEKMEPSELTESFGGLYSACCECGALLNDPLSVHLGIGPVCGGRVFGEEFKGMLKEAKAAVANK